MFTKANLKRILRLFAWILISFLIIYVIIFFFGHKLLSSGDPILYELTGAIFMGIVFWVCNETITTLEARVKALEERLNKFEGKEKMVDIDENKD